jgi:hypothetical protein
LREGNGEVREGEMFSGTKYPRFVFWLLLGFFEEIFHETHHCKSRIKSLQRFKDRYDSPNKWNTL